MSESGRYTAGYVGATFPDEVESEKAAITAGNKGIVPDKWYVDLKGWAQFNDLRADVDSGRVSRVVMRDRGVLPDNVDMIGEFFDAAMETSTELVYIDQRLAEPNERLMAQLVPLLHEWNNRESEFMAARGCFTIHAGLEDVRWLRDFIGQSESQQAKRWLEQLLPDISEYPAQ
ncbi:hypothetical protein ACWDFH_23965 [Streptomyces kronopolitis]